MRAATAQKDRTQPHVQLPQDPSVPIAHSGWGGSGRILSMQGSGAAVASVRTGSGIDVSHSSSLEASASRDSVPPEERGTSADLGADRESVALRSSSKDPRAVVLRLYDEEHVALRRYLAVLGVKSETARELLQEGFLRLHKHLLTGGDTRQLRAWLYRVLHNLARNSQTSIDSTRLDPIEDVTNRTELRANGASPESELLKSEQSRLLAETMEELTDLERECLVLRARGLKYKEIAEISGRSTSTVAETMNRAIGKMQRLLGL